MSQKFEVLPVEWSIFLARAKIVNIDVGLLALSLAGTTLETEAPRLFAFLSMAIVLLYLEYRTRSFGRVYQLWREEKHPLVMARHVWRYFPVFNIGWLALTLMSLGAVHKGGILGLTF